MERRRRIKAVWIMTGVALLATAVVVPLLVFASSGQTTLTAESYADVIRFEVRDAASLQITVYDLSEKEIWNSGVVPGDWVDWDRTDTWGDRLANGYYLYRAQAWDINDNLILSKTGKVALLPGDQVQLQRAPSASAPSSGTSLETSPTTEPALQPQPRSYQTTGNITAMDSGSGRYISLVPGPMNQQIISSAGNINLTPASGIVRMTKAGQNFAFQLDTSIQAPGIYLTTAGTSYLNGGNVGIGTTSPGEKLQVAGNIAASVDLNLNYNGVDWTYITFGSGTYAGPRLFYGGSSDFFALRDAGYFVIDMPVTIGDYFSPPGTTRLYVWRASVATYPFWYAPSTSAAIRADNDAVAIQGNSDDAAAVVGFSYDWQGGNFASHNHTGLVGRTYNGSNILELWEEEPDNLRFKVTRTGNVYADGSYLSPADFAELMPAADTQDAFGEGDVLVIGPDGLMQLSSKAADPAVAGVFSPRPGFVGDWRISEGGIEASVPDENRIAVAIIGVVRVKVTAESGAIRPGDLLVTASRAGHAMRCDPGQAQVGTVIGKALESMDGETGLIKVMVTLR